MTSISIVIGIVGTLFAYIEIWHPNTLRTIEQKITSHLSAIKTFRSQMGESMREVVERGKTARKKVREGPQFDKPLGESKQEIAQSLYYLNKIFFVYMAIPIYLMVLLPLSYAITFLSGLGKGRFIGGMGITLNIASLLISLIT